MTNIENLTMTDSRDDADCIFIRSRWGTNRYVYSPRNPVGQALIVGSLLFAADSIFPPRDRDLAGGQRNAPLRPTGRSGAGEKGGSAGTGELRSRRLPMTSQRLISAPGRASLLLGGASAPSRSSGVPGRDVTAPDGPAP